MASVLFHGSKRGSVGEADGADSNWPARGV
jgi:hypothetical protein